MHIIPEVVENTLSMETRQLYQHLSGIYEESTFLSYESLNAVISTEFKPRDVSKEARQALDNALEQIRKEFQRHWGRVHGKGICLRPNGMVAPEVGAYSTRKINRTAGRAVKVIREGVRMADLSPDEMKEYNHNLSVARLLEHASSPSSVEKLSARVYTPKSPEEHCQDLIKALSK